MNFSIEEFNKALQNSGIDKKLSDITDTVTTQLNSIIALDVSAESPSTLKSSLQSSTDAIADITNCLLYTSPSPRDRLLSRMPSSA